MEENGSHKRGRETVWTRLLADLTELSRSQAKWSLIKAGILVNVKLAKKTKYAVKRGVMSSPWCQKKGLGVQAEDIPLDIIYEVRIGSGQQTSRYGGHPLNWSHVWGTRSMPWCIMSRTFLINGCGSSGIVHRIDRTRPGLPWLLRTTITGELKDRSPLRKYVFIVHGLSA